MIIMNLDSRERKTVFRARHIEGLQWAPNGTLIAFQGIVDNNGEYGIQLYRLSAESQGQGSLVQKDVKKGEHLFSWSPDSQRIVFQDSKNRIMILDVVSDSVRRLDKGWFPTWSPDGRYIAYRVEDTHDAGYVLYDLVNDRKEIILKGEPVHRSLVWSPDSRYVAYSKVSQDLVNRSLSSGGDEIYGDIFVLNLERRRETKAYSHGSSVYPLQWAGGWRSSP